MEIQGELSEIDALVGELRARMARFIRSESVVPLSIQEKESDFSVRR
jgi:hypothetical protein